MAESTIRKVSYTPVGVCCKNIEIELENGTVRDVIFTGGCPGNHEAIRRLIKGKDINDIISILEGTPCGNRASSCADQLVVALKSL